MFMFPLKNLARKGLRYYQLIISQSASANHLLSSKLLENFVINHIIYEPEMAYSKIASLPYQKAPAAHDEYDI